MADDRWVRAALSSSRLPTLAAHGSRAVLNGFWLGVLSEDQLLALDERYYAASGHYRTAAWNEQGMFPWERQLVDAHFPPSGLVTVVACGGGREVLALLELGYEVAGYESHPDLAASGQALLTAKGRPPFIHAVGRDQFPHDAPTSDAAIIGWGAYSLIGGRDVRVAMLREARRHVVADAPVLVSYFERADSGREARLTTALANATRRARRRPPIEPGDTLAPNRIHVFSPGALAAEAGEAGFDVATNGTVGGAEEAGIASAAAILRPRP